MQLCVAKRVRIRSSHLSGKSRPRQTSKTPSKETGQKILGRRTVTGSRSKQLEAMAGIKGDPGAMTGMGVPWPQKDFDRTFAVSYVARRGLLKVKHLA